MIRQELTPLPFEGIIASLERGAWSFARYGDTEIGCMTGAYMRNVDGQSMRAEAASDLWSTIAHPRNYVYGLQPLCLRLDLVPQRIMEAVDWVNSDTLHHVNGDGGLRPFVEQLRRRKVGLVAPERLRVDRLEFLRTGGFVAVPQTDAYDSKTAIFQDVVRLAEECDAVCFCCSMLANFFVWSLAPAFSSRVSLIDCGSMWEPYAGHIIRRYHRGMSEDVIKSNLGER